MERFCMHCGSKLSEGEKFCPNCGSVVEEDNAVQNNIQNNNVQANTVNNSTQFNTQNDMTEKTNGLAIAAFVCSLVGIIIFGVIMGILAISLSITAKQRMKVFKNQKGSGLATAALVIGIIDIVFSLIGSVFNIMALL